LVAEFFKEFILKDLDESNKKACLPSDNGQHVIFIFLICPYGRVGHNSTNGNFPLLDKQEIQPNLL